VDSTSLGKLYLDHVRDLGTRYAPVLAHAGFDALVIHSGSIVKRTGADDQYWPLRPTPHFQHWLPLAQPDCALILRPGTKPTLAWLKTKSFWERPAKPEADHFLAALDVVEVAEPARIKDLLPASLAEGRLAFVGDAVSHAADWGLPESAVNPPDLVGPLDRLRAVKTPYEVACLAEANRRAALGHDAVASVFRDGSHSELDLHLLYLQATSQDDPETPYKNIVAMGPHAATLHHVSYQKRPSSRAGESLLLDAGATYLGYCSDITRTWVKGSDAEASAFVGLIDAMEKMQQRLCGAVKLGAPYEELHEDSHRQLGVILKDAGILKVSADEGVAAGVTRAFYPHGLGHSLGLQCHDVGCALVKPKQSNPYLRNTSTITEGQVFTVEPGLYFIEPLLADLKASEHGSSVNWPVVDALAKLGGIRIEDDLVVVGGPGATRNLTREHLPVGGGR
jgi:Xaa-Pro dipeptidase